MNRIWIPIALVATASTARADSKDELLRQAGEQLGVYYKWVTALTRTPTSSEELPPAERCDADVKAWKDKGVKDGDRIFSYDFNAHPKAKDNTIPLSEMKTVCIAYRALYAPYKIDHDLRIFDGTLMKIRDGVVKPGDSVLTAHVIDTYEQQGDPAACKATVAAATAADPTMLTNGISGRLTLTEYETKVCEPLAKLHPQFIADARAALAKNTAATMAPYTAAGIGGAKLELLAKYDGVSWRLPGGAVTDDPKRLAKASTLFQWLEAEDKDDSRYIVHTIRKYRFKGNDLVDTSEKQYRRKQGAPVGNVFK
jgi:hypothetical protein